METSGDFHKHSCICILFGKESYETDSKHRHSLVFIFKSSLAESVRNCILRVVSQMFAQKSLTVFQGLIGFAISASSV